MSKPFSELSKSQQNRRLKKEFEEPLPEELYVIGDEEFFSLNSEYDSPCNLSEVTNESNDSEIDETNEPQPSHSNDDNLYPILPDNSESDTGEAEGYCESDNAEAEGYCESDNGEAEGYYLSSLDSESEEEKNPTLEEQLIDDLREFCITHLPDYATDNLLKILIKSELVRGVPNFPKNHKELLGDLKDIPKPVKITGGHILHLGIRANLKLIPKIAFPTELMIQFSYDGVKRFKSSGKNLWPIVMSFPNLPSVGVKLVSIFIGSKAELDVQEFFACLVEEVNEIILKDGGMVEVGPDRQKLKFCFHLCVSDLPAKTFALGLISHTGYFACPFCHQTGSRDKSMMYDTKIGPLRTDEEFRDLADKYHQSKLTPLADLKCEIDMVLDFPPDCMHAIDLGVQRQMLDYLLSKKWIDLDKAEKLIEETKKYQPHEFPRKIRSLKDFKRYKATEHRFYGLYFGPVFLEKCIKEVPNAEPNAEKIVKHYKLFFVAYRLLMGDGVEVPKHHIRKAQQLLECFVAEFPEIYGKEQVGPNVHTLLHFSSFVERFGPLSNFSCYQYENYYNQLGKWIRNPSHMFTQVIRRWIQTEGAVKFKSKGVSNRKFDSIKLTGKNKNDSMVLLNDGNIFQIEQDFVTLNGITFMGKILSEKESIYRDTHSDINLNIFMVSKTTNTTKKQIHISQIKEKLVVLPYDEDLFVVVPLIHSTI